MKFFILISLISFNTLAVELSQYEETELARRVELYGLNSPKDPIPHRSFKEYDTSVISRLQKHIKSEFIPHIQNILGNCEKENCLTTTFDYQTLQTAEKTVCLPYTQCGFYKCMEKEYQCKPEGMVYFTDLAFPTCSTYVKNINAKTWFSQKGYEWIYNTMVCLQKGLIEECDLNKNCKRETSKKTCDYITDFTLKFHPSCYLNSGVGVCKLPLKDKINIWRTVGKFMTPRERQEAIKVVKSCIRGEN